MLSKKDLFTSVDIMIDNFLNSKDPLNVRLSNFQTWLSCSFCACLISFEDYDSIKAYGYEKIKNMEDY